MKTLCQVGKEHVLISNNTVVVTPMQLEILLSAHVRSVLPDYIPSSRRAQTEAQQIAIQQLLSNQLINVAVDGGPSSGPVIESVTLEPRGMAYLSHILSIPLPEKRALEYWVA